MEWVDRKEMEWDWIEYGVLFLVCLGVYKRRNGKERNI